MTLFYFPIKAILVTLFIMGIMFCSIAYFTPKLIHKKEIIKLFKEQKKDDKPQKLIPILLVFLIMIIQLIWLTFSKSSLSYLIQESFIFQFFIIIFIVLGTYRLFLYYEIISYV